VRIVTQGTAPAFNFEHPAHEWSHRPCIDPATGDLIVIELSNEELNTVTGAWDPGGQQYGARWSAARAAPTPAEWKAIGEQLSAIYIANHPAHLGRPLK
jgi:hypothetical protein